MYGGSQRLSRVPRNLLMNTDVQTAALRSLLVRRLWAARYA